MIEEAYAKYLSRLLLNLSDLCDSDQQIADCLTLLRIRPPANAKEWTAEIVRQQMPLAYSTACSTSIYTNRPNHQTAALCVAVFNVIKNRKDK